VSAQAWSRSGSILNYLQSNYLQSNYLQLNYLQLNYLQLNYLQLNYLQLNYLQLTDSALAAARLFQKIPGRSRECGCQKGCEWKSAG
jgi:hypothetical protein